MEIIELKMKSICQTPPEVLMNNNYDINVDLSNYPIGRFNKRYSLIEQIGRGSFGEVFSAMDCTTFKRVAVKVIENRGGGERTADREISFLIRCQGIPNIIQLNEIVLYNFNRKTHFVLELCDKSLREFLRHRSCTYTTARSIVKQICHGLSYVHSLGYIHSDLKPDNIMIIQKGEDIIVKIIDFGCVREISQIPILYPGESEDDAVYFTTRWFRSPEVILNHIQHVNHGVDLWSLGCIMYQLITRRYLFCGMNHEDMLSWFELHLGRIPKDVLERNMLTYDEYFTNPDNYYDYECDESFVSKVSEHYEDSQIEKRLQSTFMYVEEEEESEKSTVRQLKTRQIKQCLFSRYSMNNPRIYLENIIQDQNYCNAMKLLLQYDPLKRPDAICIAELLDY